MSSHSPENDTPPASPDAVPTPSRKGSRKRVVGALVASRGAVAKTWRRAWSLRSGSAAKDPDLTLDLSPSNDASAADGLILIQHAPPCATVILNRPAHRNAITMAMWSGLAEVFARLADDPAIRVIVIRGAGDKAFSAGADIAEFRTRMIGQQLARDYWRVVDEANSAVENCPKPVIALIGGFALGAACALVSACDLRIATPNAILGVPAAKIGLTLALNDTRRLVNAVGASHAREILLTGRLLSAAEALEVGLVNRVIPVDDVGSELQSLVTSIAEQAPLALRQAKTNLNIVARNPGFAGISEIEVSLAWAGSHDFVEGINAYLEKRKPHFTGE